MSLKSIIFCKKSEKDSTLISIEVSRETKHKYFEIYGKTIVDKKTCEERLKNLKNV